MDELPRLAQAAARGDRAALSDLIRATQQDVWRLCAHLVDPASADDMAQETYLRAIPALRGFRGEASVRTWLLTIPRGFAHTRSSPGCARETTARLAEASSPAPGIGLRTELTDLLAALDPDRRAAFVLTQVLGCGYAAAAAICDCPVGTIRSRVARARADLDAMFPRGDITRPDTGTSPLQLAQAVPDGEPPGDGKQENQHQTEDERRRVYGPDDEARRGRAGTHARQGEVQAAVVLPRSQARGDQHRRA